MTPVDDFTFSPAPAARSAAHRVEAEEAVRSLSWEAAEVIRSEAPVIAAVARVIWDAPNRRLLFQRYEDEHGLSCPVVVTPLVRIALLNANPDDFESSPHVERSGEEFVVATR